MSLRPNLGFQPQAFNVCSNWGGMGDLIARLPALRYIHENYAHVSMNVFWHDYFVPLAELLLPSTPRLVHWKFSEMPKANERQPLVSFTPDRVNSLSLNLTTVAFLILLDRLPPTADDMKYTLAPDVPVSVPSEPYVVVTCGFTAPAREWLPKHVNETAKAIKDLGYLPVFMGSAKPQELGNRSKIEAAFSEEIDYSIGLNLIDQTSLVEAVGVLQKAEAVVGIDNGLLHLASCTPTPVIWGFTSVEPGVRLPVSNGPQGVIVPPRKQVPCGGCQSRQFYVKHDWRQCPFNDYLCLDYMRSDFFITELKRVLGLT
jgi:ADP-heptose:LPS heptosyltransferase